MKANYNRKISARERSVTFRAKDAAFCILQSNIYGRFPNDKDTVYLDFENEEQIDKLINTLQELKNRTYKKDEATLDESETKPR